MASGEDKDTEGNEYYGNTDDDEWDLPKAILVIGIFSAFIIMLLGGICHSELGILIGVGIALLAIIIAVIVTVFIALRLLYYAIVDRIETRSGREKAHQESTVD